MKLLHSFKKNSVEIGFAVVALLFLDGLCHRWSAFENHVRFVTATLGCRRFLSIGLLVLLSFLELSSCALLALESRKWVILPLLALSSCSAFEIVVYSGWQDSFLALRFAIVQLNLCLLAMMRKGEQIRAQAIGAPLTGVVLQIEARVRAVCTLVRTATFCPLVGLLLIFFALAFHRFWCFNGLKYEIERASFQVCVSLFSLTCLLTGGDRSERLLLTPPKFVSVVYEKMRVMALRRARNVEKSL